MQSQQSRENTFLGPGPWKILRTDGLPGSAGSYVETPNSDPRHVLHNVLVWLDRLRSGRRLLVPLTFPAALAGVGAGVAVMITRRGDSYDARVLGVTRISHVRARAMPLATRRCRKLSRADAIAR